MTASTDKLALSGLRVWLNALLYMLDRPAHASIGLAGGRPVRSWLLALTGVLIIAGATCLGGLLIPGHAGFLPGSLQALSVALIFAVPAAMVIGALTGCSIPPRILLAATGVGLITGAFIVCALLPLIAFLAAAASEYQDVSVWVSPTLWFPAIGTAATGLVLARVARAFARSTRDRVFARALLVALLMPYGAVMAKALHSLL